MGKNNNNDETDKDEKRAISEEERAIRIVNSFITIILLISVAEVYLYHTGKAPFLVPILMVIIVALLVIFMFHSAIFTLNFNKHKKSNKKKKRRGNNDHDFGIHMPYRPNRGKQASGLPDFNIGVADKKIGDEEGIPEELIKSLETNFSGRRALLVEDIEINREIANIILCELGFEVEQACDGKEAVDMVKGSKPGYYDVILMDIQMPVMDGYEATRRIRKLRNKKHSQIPIVALTMCVTQEDIDVAKHAGMDGHIAKPIDISKMKKVLEKALEKDYNA